MATRPAKKASDGWYKKDPAELSEQLRRYLAEVPESIDGTTLPIPGARVVIAPHAGYDYSGPCAAWAYKTLDLSKAKRVFVLGPSHTYYLEGNAASTFAKYNTPLGELVVDQDMVQQVKEEANMDDIPAGNEVAEHSLEMHMPYLYLRCEETFGTPDKFPKIVPMLIGDNDREEEKFVGRILAPHMEDPENAFIISSDFCHWGRNFSYMVYSPTGDPSKLKRLHSSDPIPDGPPIYETIRLIDELVMNAVKSGNHDAYLESLKLTRNTVCGRHPIGAAMSALEKLSGEPGYQEGKARFNILQYRRSNEVTRPGDFSVSYVSAYAIL